jgi:hypothetical protein
MYLRGLSVKKVRSCGVIDRARGFYVVGKTKVENLVALPLEMNNNWNLLMKQF